MWACWRIVSELRTALRPGTCWRDFRSSPAACYRSAEGVLATTACHDIGAMMKQTRLEEVALRFGYWMILLCTTAIVACASSPVSRAEGDRYPGIRSDLIYHALAQLGAPYIWGGVGPDGF